MLQICGAVSIIVAAWIMWTPAGLLVAGVAALGLGVVVEQRGGE